MHISCDIKYQFSFISKIVPEARVTLNVTIYKLFAYLNYEN